MVEINWTDESQRWMRDIFDYIAEDNPIAATKVVSDIYEKAQILKYFPEIGYQYQTNTKNDIRILLYGHYRIAYSLKPKSSIDILGVFHGALNIDRYFP